MKGVYLDIVNLDVVKICKDPQVKIPLSQKKLHRHQVYLNRDP